MSVSSRPLLFIALLVVLVGCSRESSGSAERSAPGGESTSSVGDDNSAPSGQATTHAISTFGESPAGTTDTSSTAAAAAPGGGTPFWPRFHGPKGDNISTDTGLLKEWPDGGPELVWSIKGIGHGFSSVTIANGMIYTDGNIDDNTVITALDMEGNIRWQVEKGKAWTESPAGTRGTPTIDGDRLYHESPLGQVVCLNAKDGERIWDLNILDEFGAQNIQWALAESVLIDGNNLIACPGGNQASVVALDKKTGRTVWAAKGTGDKAGYASPILVEDRGLRMILTMNAKALIGVNADNGDLLFRYAHETRYDVNATNPIYRDGHVFISSGYGSGSELVKLSFKGNQVSAESVWEVKQLDNHHGGVILVDGYLYGSNSKTDRGNRWICLKWDSGEVMYSEPGVGKGSATYADGMLYILSERRKVGLVEATPAGHTVTSQFEIPEGGPEPSWPHPVVCGGRLYLRHSDQLSAYNVRAEP